MLEMVLSKGVGVGGGFFDSCWEREGGGNYYSKPGIGEEREGYNIYSAQAQEMKLGAFKDERDLNLVTVQGMEVSRPDEAQLVVWISSWA